MNFINIELKFNFSNASNPFVEGSLNIDNYRNIKLYKRTVQNCSYFDINGFNRLCLATNKLKDNECAFVIIYYNDNHLLLSLQRFTGGKIKALIIGGSAICKIGNTHLENYYCDIVEDYSRYLTDCIKENHIILNYSGDMEYIQLDNYNLFMDDFKRDCDRFDFINQPNIERLEEPDEEKKSQSAPEPVEEKESQSAPEPVISTVEQLDNIFSDIDKYMLQIEKTSIDRINSFTNEDFKKTFEAQIGINVFHKTRLISQYVNAKQEQVELKLSKLYRTKQDELQKYNRKFKLIPKHLYDALYNPDLECPICLESNIPRNKFNMSCCGHTICSDCLYNLPNNKCPTCKTIIE
jgi:hypothetical protein